MQLICAAFHSNWFSLVEMAEKNCKFLGLSNFYTCHMLHHVASNKDKNANAVLSL